MKSPKPKIEALGAYPSLVGVLGARVELSARVADALTCTFSSGKPLAGLPKTVACSGGSAATTVTIPANSKTKPLVYRLAVEAQGPHASKKSSLRVTVAAPPAGRTCAPSPEADLADCDLAYADLEGASLEGADLDDAYLAAVNLESASLERAELTGVASGEITGEPASLPAGWALVGGYVVGPGANLSYSRFAPGATLSGLDLAGANLLRSDLSGADLSYADLEGAALEEAQIGPDLAGANLTDTTGFLIRASRADLDGADLEGVNWDGDLEAATMNETRITRATLDGNLSGVLVTDSDLADSELGGTLEDASLYGDDIAGAKLESALTGLATRDLVGEPAALPAHWRLANGYLVGPYAALNAPHLEGADLADDNLEHLQTYGANLQDADLENTNLDFANLSAANLTGANLQATSLTRAYLTGVHSGSIAGTPAALPEAWIDADGYLIGPEADLVEADLAGLNLEHASMERDDLESADLDEANLDQANLLASDTYEANIANVSWLNTVCPDGTNSDEDAGTCESHLE